MDSIELGWHGLDGDRRYALRKVDDRAGFPWLTASKLPELICFTPVLPDSVRTPDGRLLPLHGDELAAEIGKRAGLTLQMTHLNRGIFDEAAVSVITATTVAEALQMGGVPIDVRRFRPNVLLATAGKPFEEDAWVGGMITFGDGPDAPRVAVTNRDERCAMVNYDPDTGRAAPEVMKAIVRTRENRLGVYATVVRRGRLAVGQAVRFTPA